ncbi:MAG: sulfite exporter TauE/SafE family protein [Actinomycetota bacterium]
MSGTELAIILAAVVVGSTVKAITGMGLPIIAIPVAALFTDFDDAVVVLAIPTALANVVLATRERHHVGETRDLGRLMLFGIAGAVVGTIAFVSLPEEPLVIALVAVIALYVGAFFVHPDLRTTPRASRRWSPAVGAIGGAFQGAVGISGPIVQAWVHSYRLPQAAHILSVTTLFGITGIVQSIVLAVDGEYTSGRLGASLLACIPVVASIPIGTRLRNRMTSRAFDLAVVAVLVLSAAALLLRTL